MPASPPFDPPVAIPNYWTYTTFSFDRTSAFPSDPQFHNVFANDIQVFDVNGDDHLDVVHIYSYIPNQDIPGIPIRIALGDGAGGLTEGTAVVFGMGVVPVADAATGVSVADFNGDGRLDLFISMHGYDQPPYPGIQNVLVLSTGASGMFDATATHLPSIIDFTHWSTAGDIDGDGDVDIFVGNLGNDEYHLTSPYFFINDGTGHFTRSDEHLPSPYEQGYEQSGSSLLFDADNDGDLDLLFGESVDAALSYVFFNDGAGNFSLTPNSALPAALWSDSETLGLNAMDLNGDGFLDLLLHLHDPTQRYIQVLINNGDGSFRDETTLRLDAYEGEAFATGRYMHMVDVNDDGALDLVLQTGDQTRFYLNDGQGRFVALPDDFLFTNGGMYAIVPGDFNEDGRLDFYVRTFVNGWDDPEEVVEFAWIATWTQPEGVNISGDEAANAVLGVEASETLSGLAGNDVIFGGGGQDTLYGGADADYLNGGVGDDALEGGEGADTLAGGAGDDLYVLGDGDVLIEYAGGGVDTVQSATSHTLGDHFENLTLTGSAHANGTGNTLANVIAGNTGSNTLSGLAGNDTLSGLAGADLLNGNDGADYIEGGAGNDTLDGGNHNDQLFGGDNADTLYGRGGNDTLDGGAGSNMLEGGGGDDTYYVRGASDVVVELAGAGSDTLVSTATRTLGNFQENLTLIGAEAINGFGNALANAIIGNDAANVLNGLAGADTLSGDGGGDTLNGGDGGDVIYGGAGIDLLDGGNDGDTLNGGEDGDTLYGRTGNDTLLGDSGGDTIFGGDGDDVAQGGDGDDLIDGLNNNDTLFGGDGADDLYGRQNNDQLYGDAGNDEIYGGDGDDQLNGGADDDLLDGGNGVDVLQGGDGADTLYGRNGDDVLDGGLGADTLSGGNDADTFVFSTALGGGNIDTILFYSAAQDTIQLDVDVFGAIGLGTLAANAFVIGTAAGDADDRIIYDPVTGALYYDADGDGAGEAVQFATLGTGLTLTAADFVGGP